MSPAPKLGAGRYFGRTLRRRGQGGVVLSELRFPPRASVPRHSHDRSIFNFVLSGGYVEYTPRRSFECVPPVLLFHPAGEVHWERFSRAGARCLTIEFDPHGVAAYGEDALLLERALSFTRGELTWIAGPLRQELYVRDDLSPMVVEAYVRLLLAAGLRRSRDGEVMPPFIERAIALLHDRFSQRLELGEVARELGVHPTHLARAFRRHCGTTPGEFVRRLRIEFACRELSRPERSIAKIAQDAGFADQSHFTRTFKRLTGTTPGHFRSEILGG